MTRRNHGFTLIEILVAMAIGSIILLGASSFLANSTDAYTRITGKISTERESRALLQQAFFEIPSARFHEDMRITKDGSTWVKSQLGFLCLMPADAQDPDRQIGDLCAVFYYVDDLPLGGSVTRCVMRGFRDSQDVFEALNADDVASLFAPDPLRDEPVAMNVVSLEATPQVIGATGSWEVAPQPLTSAPQGIQLRLVLARRSLSGRLRSADDWDGTSPLASRDLGAPENAGQNGNLQVFESIIPFGNHAPP